MKTMKMFAGVVTTLSVALPSMAWAQFEGVEGEGVTVVVSTVGLTGVSTTTGVIATLFSPAMLTTSVGTNMGTSGAQAVMMYLRESGDQVAVGVSAGSGAFFEDVSRALALDAAGEVELARALRGARHELIALADMEELDERRALEFVRRVREALRSREVTKLALEDAMTRGG